MKFSQPGGTVSIVAKHYKGRAVLEISNSGVETASIDLASHLFEPFNHAANPGDLTADGMGLSLYIDKVIMGHLGGNIAATFQKSRRQATLTIAFPTVQK